MSSLSVQMLFDAFSPDPELKQAARNQIIEMNSIVAMQQCIAQARIVKDQDSLEFWLIEVVTSSAEVNIIGNAVSDLAEEVLEPELRFAEGLVYLDHVAKLTSGDVTTRILNIKSRFQDKLRSATRVVSSEDWRTTDISKPLETGKTQQDYYNRMRAYFYAVKDKDFASLLDTLVNNPRTYLPMIFGLLQSLTSGMKKHGVESETVIKAFYDFQTEYLSGLESNVSTNAETNESSLISAISNMRLGSLSQVAEPAHSDSERVAEPNWKSFRKFWNDCEMTITPFLNGCVDIEGAHVGIAGKWLPTCNECFDQLTCSSCGRNPSNYLSVRAGDGDGSYSVYKLKFDEDPVGALVLFDSNGQMAPAIMNSAQDAVQVSDDNLNQINQFYKDFYNYFYASLENFDDDLQMFLCGEIEAEANPVYESALAKNKGFLIIGESGEGIDSNQALVTVNDLPMGKYRLYIFGSRDKSNEDIVLPRIALVLSVPAAERIGLTTEFAKKLDMAEEYQKWSRASVFARFGPKLAPAVIFGNMIIYNVECLRVISMYGEITAEVEQLRLESLSWQLLLCSGPDSANMAERFLENASDSLDRLDTLHKMRGQFGRKLVTR